MVARPAADSFRSSNLYIPSLDGMRAIAFFFVFLAHAQPFKVLPGGFGVTVFFFLSGYLITSLLRDEARKIGAEKVLAGSRSGAGRSASGTRTRTRVCAPHWTSSHP